MNWNMSQIWNIFHQHGCLFICQLVSASLLPVVDSPYDTQILLNCVFLPSYKLYIYIYIYIFYKWTEGSVGTQKEGTCSTEISRWNGDLI